MRLLSHSPKLGHDRSVTSRYFTAGHCTNLATSQQSVSPPEVAPWPERSVAFWQTAFDRSAADRACMPIPADCWNECRPPPPASDLNYALPAPEWGRQSQTP